MRTASSAWMAGVFEGEGSVRISPPTRRNPGGSLTLDMVNTDEELIAPFRDRWGGYCRRVVPVPPRSPYWRWRLSSRQAAQAIRELRPFVVSQRMKDRMDLGLEFQDQKLAGRRPVPGEYMATQADFAERMRLLNLRGVTCPEASKHR